MKGGKLAAHLLGTVALVAGPGVSLAASPVASSAIVHARSQLGAVEHAAADSSSQAQSTDALIAETSARVEAGSSYVATAVRLEATWTGVLSGNFHLTVADTCANFPDGPSGEIRGCCPDEFWYTVITDGPSELHVDCQGGEAAMFNLITGDPIGAVVFPGYQVAVDGQIPTWVNSCTGAVRQLPTPGPHTIRLGWLTGGGAMSGVGALTAQRWVSLSWHIEPTSVGVSEPFESQGWGRVKASYR